MQFSDNFNLKPTNILKISGLSIVAIVIIVLAFRLINSSFDVLSRKTGGSASMISMMGGGELAYDMALSQAEISYNEMNDTAGLSIRNVANPVMAPAPTNSDIVIGDNAEELEVTEYNASIETRQLKDTCDQIKDLKARTDVIFENANEYERGCYYNFKVKKEGVGEILALITALDPKELSDNTYTIKNLVDDYTSETTILEKKKLSIEETLANAVSAYDDITVLATKAQNVESLTKIIDSKIGIIERLTRERINVNDQLERLGRSKAEQLDRLNYTYFNVHIAENKFIDGQNLKDSWKLAVKLFVNDINSVLQDVTINLVALLFVALQYFVYFFILLIIVKYVWRAAKYIWFK